MPIKTALLSKTHPFTQPQSRPPRPLFLDELGAAESARAALKKQAMVAEICSALAALDAADPPPACEP